MPGEPATTATADCHLWALRGRGASERATSASSITHTRARLTSRPMSATSTRPASNNPSPWTRPVLRAAKVTVRSARRGSPSASPLSPSTPDGMSTASTGTPGGTDGAR